MTPLVMGVSITFLKKKIKNDQHDERNFFASSIFWSELIKYKTFEKQWELIDWAIRLLFEPIPGWLENLGKKIFEWHFCVEWWKILDSLSFDRKFLTQQNYNLGKFLKENFWLRRWKILDRKFWILVLNGCTIFDNQTI